MRIDGISVAHLLQFLTTSFGGIRFAIRALRVTPYRVGFAFLPFTQLTSQFHCLSAYLIL